ncbi:MAG: hypothetical protein DI551_04645 [Micavibrio aeruginosavorus]|uniref:FlgO domain-containing protein n=1 Tax=Micavibrio aeruginosavorus TaxID=349221 RepID=A0A2W5N103_9BACT|nr:MAG: hypothetical protein DI551_04645 [Micavibrio aeruginosavorus]
MIAQQKQVNLTNASYAAAETLGQQAGKRFRHERPLMVEDLQEIIDMNQKKPIANPKVGRVLSAQMRSRFKQLGYNVVDMTPYRGEGSDPGAEVSGTYELINSRMNVFLKMADKRTGEVITIYEYSLPITYDIKKYMTGNANMLPPLWTN